MVPAIEMAIDPPHPNLLEKNTNMNDHQGDCARHTLPALWVLPGIRRYDYRGRSTRTPRSRGWRCGGSR